MIDPDDWCCTSGQLSELLGLHAKQLSRYHAQGMPKQGHGRWHLPSVLRWLMAHLTEGTSPDATAEELARARQVLLEAQGAKARIELEQLERSVYDAGIVHEALAELAVIHRAAHRGLPTLAPRLVGKPSEVIVDELEDWSRECSSQIADAIEAFEVDPDHPRDPVAPTT